MYCKFLGQKGSWREVANAANTTIGREAGKSEPTSSWKKRILLAEHSPIRQLVLKAKWYNLKYWISVHLVRHKIGIEHWVKSQRPDRLSGRPINYKRDEMPQGAFIEHEIEVNAQAIINISRKRLCNMAMPETREAWKAFIKSIQETIPELVEVCVPDCIYRGYCYEYKTCGYHTTDEYQVRLKMYRRGINEL